MQERNRPETLRLRAVTPALTVNDIEKSLGWYRDVLGFVVEEEFRHEDRLRGAKIVAGSVDLLLSQDDFAKGRDRVKGVGLRLYCASVQDIDALAAGIKGRGGVLDHEPMDQPWGSRDFALTDPDGFKLSIATAPEG